MPLLKYLQLPFTFDAAKLRHEVNQLENTSWKLHYQQLYYEGEWSAIPLRSIDGRADCIIISPNANAIYSDTFFLQHCPYIQTVLQTFQCPLKAVRLLKLNAGAVIKEHRDAELNYENGEIRLHIPINTHADVAFYLDHEQMHLQTGECWYMNFNLPHSISNKSPVHRIHLVIDAVVNDWVHHTFTDPLVIVKKEIADISKEHSPEVKKQIVVHLRTMNTETSNRMADELEACLPVS